MTVHDEVTVRRATADDTAALGALRWDWRAGERGETGRGRPEFDTQFAAWHGAHLESHPAFLAELDGEAVGEVWLAIVERVPGPAHWLRLSGYVQAMYVRPEHRNRGIGARLVQALIADATDRGLDYLAVHPSDQSFPFYERLGFHPSAGVLELGVAKPRRR